MARRVVALVTGLVASFGLCACTENFGSDLSNAGWQYDEEASDLQFRSETGTPTRDPRGDDGGGGTTGGTDGGSDSTDDGAAGDPNGGDGGGIYIGNGLQDPTGNIVDPGYGLNTAEGMLASLPAEHQTLAEYLVECALAPHQFVTKEVDGLPVDFYGLLGVATEWHDGACDESCQQWVTACMLGRTNVSGAEVVVGLRSDHDEIGTSPTTDYPLYEASWYGNLFTDPPVMYMCEGNTGGTIAALREGRTCIGDLCEFTNVGSCLTANRCDVLSGTRVECTDDSGVAYRTLSTYVDSGI